MPNLPSRGARGARGVAALLVGLQSVVLLGFAAFYVYELWLGEGSDATRVLMSAVLILVGALALAVVCRGWLRGAAWPRTPTIVWSLLLVPVGVGLIQGDRALVGWGLVAVAVVGTLSALAVRDGDDAVVGRDGSP